MESSSEKLVALTTKLDGLIDTVNEMKAGLWKRVADHDQRLPVIEDRVNDLRRIGWLVISCIVAQFIGVVAAVVLYKAKL